MKKTIVSIVVIVVLILFFAIVGRILFHHDDVQHADTENYERIEPFKDFYENSVLETVCFEGTVRRTSVFPDPKTNDYDHCLYAIFLELESVLSDTPLSRQMPYEAILAVPIMKDKTIIKENIFYPGDKIHCICAEYEAMPLEIQRIQLSDDIQSYDHQQYFPIEIRKITSFRKGGNRNFAKREITFLPIQTLPEDNNATSLRKERIQNEIARIEEEIRKHGGSFEKWKEEYKPIGEKYIELYQNNWKGWIDDCYFEAYKPETSYQTNDYIQGILPYKQYLEDNNIDLIVLRVPSKPDFAARVLAADDFQENPAWIEHYYECLKNDIEIVDPMPEMWKHRFDFPLFYFAHKDDHPFEGEAFISAKVISDVLKRYQFSTSDQPIELEDYSSATKEERYYWPKGNDKFNPKKTAVFSRVVRNKETIGALSLNTGSPFLFVSNCYFRFPDSSQGASVPGYTAFHLQHIPDWFYQDGTSNPLLRMLVGTPEVLQKRHAVIMIGHPHHWDGSFPVFPKYLMDKPESISLEKTLEFSSSDITKHDNGSFKWKQDHDVTTITPKNRKTEASFEIELEVPYYKDKTTCMLRINFEKTTFLTIRAYDADKHTVFDTATLSIPNTQTPIDLSPNLFIPASESRTIFIEFYGRDPFSVKNIELWYY